MIIDWTQFCEKGLPTGQKKASVTIGVFDGVHRGHRSLIERVVSHNADNVPVVITFRENHKSGKTADNIQSFDDKAAMLESLGVEILLVIDFTDSIRRMAGIEFFEALLKRCNVGFFAVGSAFRCGHQLDTDAAAIQKFFAARNIPVEIVPEVTENSLPISSSRIRAAIAAGDIPLAQAMLGRDLDG
ncbi:MAG: FAD synthetase family protein [Treponema sp.]|jgi:riboflavin kinase/FMN adenylyltransferase|nr:FAD synthetase family protein [Treponema sp.]